MIKVHSWVMDWFASRGFTFYDIRPDGHYIYNFLSGEFQKQKEGEEIPKECRMQVTERWQDEILKALLEHINERGIRTENENKIEGKLEATERHLKDLRQLLKLKGGL